MPEKIKIAQLSDRVLRETAREVPVEKIRSPKIQKLIADMKETLKNTPNGVGLAASQVGESLRIFIVSEESEEITKAEENGYERRKKETFEKNAAPYEKREWKYYVFINPLVKNTSRRKLAGSEGCLSVRGKYGAVKRPEKITVEAYDENGKKFTRGASKFLARVIQHELDHLNGILFIDKAEELFDVRREERT